MPNWGSLLGRTKLKDASRTRLTCYWHSDLKQVQSKAMASELWGSGPQISLRVPPAMLQGEDSRQRGLEIWVHTELHCKW